MAERKRYVNTDSTAGGDGTTNATAGANRAYATSAECEANEQDDLVTDTDYFVAECSAPSGVTDTVFLNITTWTTNATYYVKWQSGASDRATPAGWDGNKYSIETAAGDGIRTNTGYVYLDGLQIDSADQTVNIFQSAGHVYISNCRIQGGATQAIYLAKPGDSVDLTIWNTIVDGAGTDGIYYRAATNCNVYNSIVYGSGDDGIERVEGTVNVYNSAVFGSVDEDFRGTFGTIDYCASDDGTGTNPVAPSGADWDNEYVDSANGDFTLVASGNCEGGGTDNPGSGLYSTDMDGDAYSSPWSIGVDAKSGGTIYDMSATGEIAVEGSAIITNIGAMSSTGEIAVEGSANISALQSLLATGEIAVEGSAAIIAIVSMTANGEIEVEGTGKLNGIFGLSANAEIGVEGQAVLNIIATMAANGEIAVEGSANLTFVGVDEFSDISFFTATKKGDEIKTATRKDKSYIVAEKKGDEIKRVVRRGV